MSIETFKQSYKTVAENPPKPGDVLRAYGGEPARLTIELVEGKPPFIYGRAYVPSIVGARIDSWVLQHSDTKSNYGWKCVLLPKAREEVLRRFPQLPDMVPVNALRVVRYSQTKNSILCEVAEWTNESMPALQTEQVEASS